MSNSITSGCIIVMVILIILDFLEALIVQFLWNWLVPIFWITAPILTYWQAFGVCILLSIVGSAFRSVSK